MGWLSGWTYRKSHVINPASGAGTNYQVRIRVNYRSGTDSGENVYLNGRCRSDFGDIRFTRSDGTTLLDYWMETFVSGSYAIFWVKVADDLSSNPATIYIYYGKSDATTTSHGDNTFIFFDHFYNLSKWVVESGSWWAQDSILWCLDGGSLRRALTHSNCAIRSRATIATDADYRSAEMMYRRNVDYTAGYKAGMWRHSGLFPSPPHTGINIDRLWWSTASKSKTISDGVWYVQEIRVFGGTHILEFNNDGDPVTVTDTRYSSGDYIGIRSVPPAMWDWYLVRKYVSPEPSHGAWGSEESAYRITGVVRDQYGNVVPNATVWLFRTSDKAFIAETVSDQNGVYTFSVYDDTTDYFIRAHKDGNPNIFGTTDRNLRGVRIQ